MPPTTSHPTEVRAPLQMAGYGVLMTYTPIGWVPHFAQKPRACGLTNRPTVPTRAFG